MSKVRDEEQLGRTASGDLINKVALKVEQGSAGLPVGVQVVARPWREHVALAAMQAIEQEVSVKGGQLQGASVQQSTPESAIQLI